MSRMRDAAPSHVQAIRYRGRLVALASATHVVLADHLAAAHPHDPERTFVVFMCLYARDVARGVLPGPYTVEEARRYARAALIPHDVAAHPTARFDVVRTAAKLGVPAEELRAARREAALTCRPGRSRRAAQRLHKRLAW